MSANSLALAPRVTVMLRQDPKVVPSATLSKCACRIIDGADEDGYFEDSFTIGDIYFEIKCQLIYSPFREDNGAITGVVFNYANAEAYDRNGFLLETDFTEAELSDYIRS